jgi:hypothetical protein
LYPKSAEQHLKMPTAAPSKIPLHQPEAGINS